MPDHTVERAKERLALVNGRIALPDKIIFGKVVVLEGQKIVYITDKDGVTSETKCLDVTAACQEYEWLLKAYPADMVATGWSESGHIAFNDPPYAKFEDTVWVKVVQLAEASRRQQVSEGHFSALSDVPTHAITLTSFR